MRSTLQSKIAIAMWTIAAASTLASAALAGMLLVSAHRESIRQQLQATATTLVSLGITHFSELRDFEEMNRFIEDALQMDRIDKIIRIYDGRRELIFTTAGADSDVSRSRLEQKVDRPTLQTIEGRQRRYESLVMPYEAEGSRKTFYLQVSIPLPRYAEMLGYLWWQSLLLLGLLIGVAVIVSHGLSRRLLAPVGQIARHLERMDPARIEEWSPLVLDERHRYLKAIADGINLLAERMQAAILKLRKMSRYVAHEMRTPLTILQGEAEMVLAKGSTTGEEYEQVLRSSLEEIGRMSEIVSTVLQVGEPLRGGRPQPVALELCAWIAENRRRWERTLCRPIDIDVPAGREVRVTVDPKLLSRLVENLIRNVKNHAPAEARCSLFVTPGPAGTSLLIADNGPGLSPDAVASLNEKGGLSEAAGIGLNLCHRITEICGLELLFANRTGGGLGVEIRFPG